MFRAIKNIFAKENSVKGASMILVITLALSNILGVIRDHFLASKIPTDRLDIYFAAFRLPDLIFNVLILGSIAAAFVPVYSTYLREEGDKKATELAQATMTVGVTVIAAALAVLFFLMPYVIYLLVPSFDIAKRQETVILARWLLISPLFFTISYFLGGVLNSHKRFLAYSIAPLIYNLSIIVAVFFFADRLGVKAAVYGVIIGSALHMLIQLPSAFKLGFRFKFIFDLANIGVKKIIKLMVPRAIGLGANQILLVAYTSFASAFAGGIAVYNFADNIQTVPSVIFGNSFAMAVFPTLAGLSLSITKDRDEFQRFFTKTLRAVTFFLVPSTAMLILLRAQIIRIILGYGFFGWSDTKTAAATLGFFALSIIAQGLIPLLARSFYAMHDTKTPMYSSIIAILTSIILGFVFTRLATGAVGGVSSLALAFTIGSWLNFALLVYFLNRQVDFDWNNLITFIFKVVLLTAVMATVMQIAKNVTANLVDIDRVRFLALQILVALIVGAGTYLGLAWWLEFEEVKS
ncbi:MAG: murein biosynthesis integral membrane protein MurJ [Candidatus Berkelbacteria bacterium]|nr:murein biosynthesis integral membrane protein MurJ [Candidatus Berkelbacteria bacterium]